MTKPGGPWEEKRYARHAGADFVSFFQRIGLIEMY